jgi:hypothetical protein
MQLGLGCATRHRAFGKMFRRVANSLEPLIKALGQLRIDHRDYDGLLIGVTDDQCQEFFEIVENSERFLQVLVGCRPDVTDEELHLHLIVTARRVIGLCPLTSEEHNRCESLISGFLPSSFGRNQQASD